MIKRLALLALVPGALAACNDNATEPAAPMSFSAAATRVTTPLSAPELPTLACPTSSPADQITAVVARISASNLSADVKAQITESLQHALTALSNRDLTAAATALQSALTTLGASRAPQPVKDAVSTLLNCLITQLSA
jgi:hypothetical protein